MPSSWQSAERETFCLEPERNSCDLWVSYQLDRTIGLTGNANIESSTQEEAKGASFFCPKIAAIANP